MCAHYQCSVLACVLWRGDLLHGQPGPRSGEMVGPNGWGVSWAPGDPVTQECFSRGSHTPEGDKVFTWAPQWLVSGQQHFSGRCRSAVSPGWNPGSAQREWSFSPPGRPALVPGLPLPCPPPPPPASAVPRARAEEGPVGGHKPTPLRLSLFLPAKQWLSWNPHPAPTCVCPVASAGHRAPRAAREPGSQRGLKQYLLPSCVGLPLLLQRNTTNAVA